MFGMSLQAVGFAKIPRPRCNLFLIKSKDGLALLDIDSEQLYQLNYRKSTNSSMAADLLKLVPAQPSIDGPRAHSTIVQKQGTLLN